MTRALIARVWGIVATTGAALVAGCGGSTGPSVSYTHPAVAAVDSVPVPGRAYGVAISRSGRTYVTLLDASSVVQDAVLPVDGFTAPIPVGILPPHVVFNPAGDRAYTANQGGNSLSVISVASGAEIATVPLGNPGFNLITSADGRTVFVSVSTGQVYRVDVASNAIIDSIILGPAVNGFARNPKRDVIYISSRDGQNVSEVDVATDAVLRTFTTGGRPQRLAVSPDGKELLVANEDHGLEIWSLAGGTRDTALAMPAYGLGLSPDGVKAYVTDPGAGRIRIVDRLSRSVDTVLAVGGVPRNVAFDRAGHTAVITNEADFVTVVH
jgi:YVTN family beta-propeller protein